MADNATLGGSRANQLDFPPRLAVAGGQTRRINELRASTYDRIESQRIRHQHVERETFAKTDKAVGRLAIRFRHSIQCSNFINR